MKKGFVTCFLKVPLAGLGSTVAVVLPVELSEPFSQPATPDCTLALSLSWCYLRLLKNGLRISVTLEG